MRKPKGGFPGKIQKVKGQKSKVQLAHSSSHKACQASSMPTKCPKSHNTPPHLNAMKVDWPRVRFSVSLAGVSSSDGHCTSNWPAPFMCAICSWTHTASITGIQDGSLKAAAVPCSAQIFSLFTGWLPNHSIRSFKPRPKFTLLHSNGCWPSFDAPPAVSMVYYPPQLPQLPSLLLLLLLLSLLLLHHLLCTWCTTCLSSSSCRRCC